MDKPTPFMYNTRSIERVPNHVLIDVDVNNSFVEQFLFVHWGSH